MSSSVATNARATGNQSNRPPRLHHTTLREIASSTLSAVETGSYELDGVIHDLAESIQFLKQNTEFYSPDSELSQWSTVPGATPSSETKISLIETTTLDGSRRLSTYLASAQTDSKVVGVLNFASAKNPGGGFIRGAQAQEESIARSSTIYPSLITPTAKRFYASHKKDPKAGYYSHAMIYSPRVALIREDRGAWMVPIEVDVLTSPAVNTGVVRRQLRPRKKKDETEEDNNANDEDDAAEGNDSDNHDQTEPAGGPVVTEAELEARIEAAMRERMARILYLFEKKGVKNLVLGSFGTGVFKNKVDMVARLWVELLLGKKEGEELQKARFARSFDRVFFAVIHEPTFKTFVRVFEEGGVGVVNDL
ncbi:hypothetical protein BDN72DRAFT_893018 [Pluteus cervinus]|uniref:Uncharacterized protein n=1 Tax=Pluteus cervinus TaxID=181527 RepID=A0ACD3BCE2_9AGAR|nr:hypothetical protein BDN72DRAFT_893018 [Pluteus cervinus]